MGGFDWMNSLFLSIEEVPMSPASTFGPIDLSKDKAGDFSTVLSFASAVCSVGLGSDGFGLDGLGGLFVFF